MKVEYVLILAIIMLIVIISQMYSNRNKYKRMALTDALTGLPNRRALNEDLRREVSQRTVVYFIDLDNFKTMNDQYGHDCGDVILKVIAARLALIQSNHIYRVGGDEFIFMTPFTNEKVHEMLACVLLDSIKQPIEIKERQIEVAATIGISEGSVLKDRVIKEADQALLLAKRYRKGSSMYYSADEA